MAEVGPSFSVRIWFSMGMICEATTGKLPFSKKHSWREKKAQGHAAQPKQNETSPKIQKNNYPNTSKTFPNIFLRVDPESSPSLSTLVLYTESLSIHPRSRPECQQSQRPSFRRRAESRSMPPKSPKATWVKIVRRKVAWCTLWHRPGGALLGKWRSVMAGNKKANHK